MSVCGLQAEHERPLEMQVGTDTGTWPRGLLQEKTLQKTNSSEQTGMKAKSEDGVWRSFWKEESHQWWGTLWMLLSKFSEAAEKANFPERPRQIATFFIFAYMFNCMVISCLVVGGGYSRKLLVASLIAEKDFQMTDYAKAGMSRTSTQKQRPINEAWPTFPSGKDPDRLWKKDGHACFLESVWSVNEKTAAKRLPLAVFHIHLQVSTWL